MLSLDDMIQTIPGQPFALAPEEGRVLVAEIVRLRARIAELEAERDNRFKCQGCGAEFPLIRGNIKTLERAKIEGEGVTHCSQCVENGILAGTVKELKSENAALREKLVQIRICAENARWGRTDPYDALDNIMEAALRQEGK